MSLAAFIALAVIFAAAMTSTAGASSPQQYQAAASYDGKCRADEQNSVTVVVDFQQLGAGILIRCATGLTTDTRGMEALSKAGISVEPTANNGGFVCRVAGLPQAGQALPIPGDDGYTENCQQTPPASAFWGYWWAKPGGSWTFSSSGASVHRVNLGGFEGWSFSLGASSGTNPQPRVMAALDPLPQPTLTTSAAPSSTKTSSTKTSSTKATSTQATQTNPATPPTTVTTPKTATSQAFPPASSKTTAPETISSPASSASSSRASVVPGQGESTPAKATIPSIALPGPGDPMTVTSTTSGVTSTGPGEPPITTALQETSAVQTKVTTGQSSIAAPIGGSASTVSITATESERPSRVESFGATASFEPGASEPAPPTSLPGSDLAIEAAPTLVTLNDRGEVTLGPRDAAADDSDSSPVWIVVALVLVVGFGGAAVVRARGRRARTQ